MSNPKRFQFNLSTLVLGTLGFALIMAVAQYAFEGLGFLGTLFLVLNYGVIYALMAEMFEDWLETRNHTQWESEK